MPKFPDLDFTQNEAEFMPRKFDALKEMETKFNASNKIQEIEVVIG